jgi:hypothetical protein
MGFKETKELLIEANEEALLADGLEDALVGIANRFGMPPVAAYDRDKCIEIFMKRDGMDHEGAEEHFEFNVIGAWMGECTPVFVTLTPEQVASS